MDPLIRCFMTTRAWARRGSPCRLSAWLWVGEVTGEDTRINELSRSWFAGGGVGDNGSGVKGEVLRRPRDAVSGVREGVMSLGCEGILGGATSLDAIAGVMWPSSVVRPPGWAVSLALISSKIACRLDRTGKAWTGGAASPPSQVAWSLLEAPSSGNESGSTSRAGEYLLFTSAVPSR